MRSRRGFTLVELMIVVGIGAVIAAISIPNLLQSRKNAAESAAIGAMKTLCTAEAIFREGDKENDGNLDYGMLSELLATNLVDPLLGSGKKQGYLFEASYSFSTSEFLWFATANPVAPGITGDRYWLTNMAGVIFYTTGQTTFVDTNSCLLPAQGVIPT
jgi:prepilin-type N-terminal cleavage/methylation domain-containing protein